MSMIKMADQGRCQENGEGRLRGFSIEFGHIHLNIKSLIIVVHLLGVTPVTHPPNTPM